MHYDSFNKRLLDKIDNALTVYEKKIYEPVAVIGSVKALETREHFRTPPRSGYRDMATGDAWGAEYGSVWIHTAFLIPAELEGDALYLCENTGAREVLAFVNGQPRGMFSVVNDHFFAGRQNAVILTENAKAGTALEIDLECYAWHYEPGLSAYDNIGKDRAPDSEFRKYFENISIVRCDERIKQAVVELRIALQAAGCKEKPFLQAKACALLEKAFGELVLFPDLYDREEYTASIQKAVAYIKPLFEGNPGRTNGYAGIIGHSHMDTAWLWPVDETVRKCARTFSNALTLMRQFPDYRFLQSSVLHTYWMEKHYPSIFAEIREQVAAGRYEPNGAAWVECDCNMTGGEYLIRQFVKGQGYLREKFGYTADSFWLPDTFGYSAALPQIMQGCGVKYFYTTKLDWNEHNRFPFESFRWQGLDGSEVIAHLNIIGCPPDVTSIVQHVHSLQNKQADDGRLIAFGYGDGGGGPTEAMVAMAQRVQKIDGLPQTEYTTLSAFGQRLEEKKEELPVYSGELYLELHRGTLTQMHDIKRNNRKAEIALHNMELIQVLTGTAYDAQKYDEMVKQLLLNQFHDILPGTGLQCVHERSLRDTTALLKKAEAETKRLMNSVLEAGAYITLVNPTSFTEAGPVHIPADKGIRGAKNQPVTDVSGRKLVAVSGISLEGYEARSFETGEIELGQSPFAYDGCVLNTPYYAITFEENGYITSWIDKQSGRELRRKGAEPLGTFYLGENIAVFWDNWDVEYDQKFKMQPVRGYKGRKVVSDGPVEIRLRSEFALSDVSSIVQDMIAYADSPRVDFQTKIIWNEKHKLLKVGFDVDVFSAAAKHEVQFGCIERPTTENDSFEAAKFEVCNHKWTDLSESRFGAALLNDSKYGISVRGSDMRLSLHTGGCRPDPSGDAGVHETTYSILPHGAFSAGNVIKQAYACNYGIQAFSGRLKKDLPIPVKADAENIICETVKPAEDNSGACVLRFYEAEKNQTVVTLTFPEGTRKAYLTNMLEEVLEEIPLENHRAAFTFKPFEIKTIKIFVK